jgi:hypothetical protein
VLFVSFVVRCSLVLWLRRSRWDLFGEVSVSTLVAALAALCSLRFTRLLLSWASLGNRTVGLSPSCPKIILSMSLLSLSSTCHGRNGVERHVCPELSSDGWRHTAAALWSVGCSFAGSLTTHDKLARSINVLRIDLELGLPRLSETGRTGDTA